MKYLYLAVTPDKYELPLNVEESTKELAEKLGVKPNAISSAISKDLSGIIQGRKFIKVLADE